MLQGKTQAILATMCALLRCPSIITHDYLNHPSVAVMLWEDIGSYVRDMRACTSTRSLPPPVESLEGVEAIGNMSALPLPWECIQGFSSLNTFTSYTGGVIEIKQPYQHGTRDVGAKRTGKEGSQIYSMTGFHSHVSMYVNHRS